MLSMEQAIRKIMALCVRCNHGLSFDCAGDIWTKGGLRTVEELVALINEGEQRRFFGELVAMVRRSTCLKDGHSLKGSPMDALLKECEECLAQQ